VSPMLLPSAPFEALSNGLGPIRIGAAVVEKFASQSWVDTLGPMSSNLF